MEYVVVNHADRELTRMMRCIPFALLDDCLCWPYVDQVHWIAAGGDAPGGRPRSFCVPAGIGEVPNDVEAQLLSSKPSSPSAVDGNPGILGRSHNGHLCRSLRSAGLLGSSVPCTRNRGAPGRNRRGGGGIGTVSLPVVSVP